MGLCDHGIHLLDVFPWLIDSHITGVWGGETFPAGRSGRSLPIWNTRTARSGNSFTRMEPTRRPYPMRACSLEPRVERGKLEERSRATGELAADPGCIHVHGTLGSLRIFHYANVLLHRVHDGVRQVRVADRPMPANFAMQLEAFAKAIQSGNPTPVSGEVGLEAVRTLLGIYAQSGRPAATTLQALDPHCKP